MSRQYVSTSVCEPFPLFRVGYTLAPGDHVVVRTLVDRDIPFEMGNAGGGKRIDLEPAGHPERCVGDGGAGAVFPGQVSGRDLVAFDLGLPNRNLAARPLDDALRPAGHLHHHVLARDEVARQRHGPLRGAQEPRVTVDIDVRSVDPVLGREPPIAPDHAPVAVGRDVEVVGRGSPVGRPRPGEAGRRRR